MLKNCRLFGVLVAMAVGGCSCMRPEASYLQKLENTELLYEAGDIALFSGETESDIAFNKKNAEVLLHRNSLFMRRHIESGREEWSIVITAGGDWKIAEGMDDWCESRAREARREFDVLAARLSKDRRYIWLVCNPHTYTYNIICSFNLATKTFRVLIDGDTVEEQPDGTILVKAKKTYLNDEDGEPLGAAWYDLWMTPDGEVVRKTEPVRRNS